VLVLHCADPSRGCSVSASPAPAPSTIEATTIRKVRMRIIPFVFVLFVIAVLDRNNIGFAALTMNKELAISSQQYGFIAGIFFFGYFIFEIPSNLMLHRIGARVWIARILVTWGIVAMLGGFAQRSTHLYLVRFLLGVAEAGYFPGIMLYLTYWFRQRQLAQAVALFCTANPVANIIGAPFSGMILDHIHWFGLSSWRWLLILEGLPAIVGGICTYFLLPTRPAEANFLSSEEKDWIATELLREERGKRAHCRVTAGEALLQGRVWHLTSIYFCAMLGLYSMIFWMPQLLKLLSSQYSNTTVGLLVMIPYVVGLPVMILVGRSSDRSLERRYHAAIPLMIAAISLFVLGATATNSVLLSVILWCFAASGIVSLWGPFWSLPNEFLTGFSAAAGIALINCFGNLGGFVGPYAIGAISKKTGSFHGGLVFVAFSLFASAMLTLALRKSIVPETAEVAMTQASPVVLPTPNIDS
jgi:MFS transporter, ACS family, tartrate transporter